MAWVTKHSTETYEPIQEPHYTRGQKIRNWWDYHKWPVLIGILACAVLIFMVRELKKEKKPDYQIGVVAEQELPADTFAALQEQLKQFGDDVNGDGTVFVQINQYTVQFDSAGKEPDAYSQMAGVTKLGAELQEGQDCFIFLLKDAAGFEKNTQALARLDGSIPADNEIPPIRELCLRWEDCPVLTALPLGHYRGYTLMDTEEGESQDILKDFYLARRAGGETPSAAYRDASVLWDRMTKDAAVMQ